MECMTPHSGLEWVHEQMRSDPCFADTEMTLRRSAIQVQRQLRDDGKFRVTVPVIRHDRNSGYGSFMEVVVESQINRIGGVEELLMIEEQLRRAIRDVYTGIYRG